MICVYLERSDLDLEGKLNHKVFMRKEKDFIYRLALCQSLWQLVPKCHATEGRVWTHIPNEVLILGSGVGSGDLRTYRLFEEGPRDPVSLLPLKGTWVLIAPPKKEMEPNLDHLRREAHVYGNEATEPL